MSLSDVVLALLWLASCALFALIGWASRRSRRRNVTLRFNRPMTEAELGRLNDRAKGAASRRFDPERET